MIYFYSIHDSASVAIVVTMRFDTRIYKFYTYIHTYIHMLVQVISDIEKTSKTFQDVKDKNTAEKFRLEVRLKNI